MEGTIQAFKQRVSLFQMLGVKKMFQFAILWLLILVPPPTLSHSSDCRSSQTRHDTRWDSGEYIPLGRSSNISNSRFRSFKNYCQDDGAVQRGSFFPILYRVSSNSYVQQRGVWYYSLHIQVYSTIDEWRNHEDYPLHKLKSEFHEYYGKLN